MVQLVTSSQFRRANPVESFFRGRQQRGALDLQNAQLGQIQGQQVAEQQKQALLQQLLGGQTGTPPIAQQQLGAGQQADALRQLQVQFPKQAQEIAVAQRQAFDNQSAKEKRRIESVVQGAAEIQGLPVDQQIARLEQRRGRLLSQGIPTNDTDEAISLLRQGRVDEVAAITDQAVQLGERLGFIKPGQKPTSLQQNLAAAGLKPGTPEFEQAVLQSVTKPQTQISIDESNLSLDEKIELAGKTKRAEKLAETRAKGVAERESLDIAAGAAASRAVPNLQRSLDLLGEIETGGIDAVLLKGKQFLGVESGNEAELVNALNKNVIAQLRPVFGAQFTKAEGDWLKAIEAGQTKSTEGNTRLIERGLFLAKKRAEAGLKAAVAAKDFRSAQEIQDFLETDLTPPQDQGAAQLTDDDLKSQLGL